MKGKYKRNQVWCSNCDCKLVPIGLKCPNCGKIEYASKIKKPSTSEILNLTNQLK